MLTLYLPVHLSGHCCSKVYPCVLLCCIDIDECVEQSPCDSNAECTNTPGSFTCACNEGYSGDGMTCAGEYFNAADANLCLCVAFMPASAPVRTLK